MTGDNGDGVTTMDEIPVDFKSRLLAVVAEAADRIEREQQALGLKSKNGVLTLGIRRDGRSVEVHWSRYFGEIATTDKLDVY